MNYNKQFNQPKKTRKKSLTQKPWFVPAILILIVVVIIVITRNRAQWFKNDNPYNMNYITLDDFKESLDEKVSPKNEKNYMLIYGSGTCGACKNLYKILGNYNKKLDEGFKNGYIPNYAIDIDKDKTKALTLADEFILDHKYRTFRSQEEKIILEISTPTIFFVVNSKLKDIIIGSPQNQLEIIKYVKSQYNN